MVVLQKYPELHCGSLEYSRSAGGNVTVSHGVANVQRGTWNSDAIAMILIVSRRRQSEV